MSAQDDRPWITCHVLDTVAGKPAQGIKCTLELLDLAKFSAITNADGRVTYWQPTSYPSSFSDEPLAEVIAAVASSKEVYNESLRWKITFETGEYYGEGNTFWPQVDLQFWTKVGEPHYHVPLLLGPWSYTTYRGS